MFSDGLIAAGKELPIGKTYLDNVLRAMTEGGT